MNDENVARFRELMGTVNRDGKDNLMTFIEKSDFYTAPASTRFHGDYEGGLLQHSLNVYDRLVAKTSDPMWKDKLSNIDADSFVVVALLHDICKTYYYKEDTRNVKKDGQWVQVPYYTVEDKIPYGHGEKSVMMIEEYMKLKPYERYSIRWHMGAYSGQQDWNTLGSAMDKYPLVLALQEADLEATYIIEK